MHVSILLCLPCVLFCNRYIQENKAIWHLPRQLCEASVPVKWHHDNVIPSWQGWWDSFPDGVFKQWRNRQFMNVIDKRWEVLGGCGYVVHYWVECVALFPWSQGVICLLKKRQILVYSAAFVYSSPSPSKSFDDNLNLYGVLTSEKASGKHMV